MPRPRPIGIQYFTPIVYNIHLLVVEYFYRNDLMYDNDGYSYEE